MKKLLAFDKLTRVNISVKYRKQKQEGVIYVGH